MESPSPSPRLAPGPPIFGARRKRSPDAILLDLALGDINGFDVFRALRSDPRTRTIPVVLITGRSSADLLASAGKCSGAFELLRKPVDLSKLAETLRAALDLRAKESKEGDPDVVKSGPLRIDLLGRRVYVNETPLRLGRSRREILVLGCGQDRIVSIPGGYKLL